MLTNEFSGAQKYIPVPTLTARIYRKLFFVFFEKKLDINEPNHYINKNEEFYNTALWMSCSLLVLLGAWVPSTD